MPSSVAHGHFYGRVGRTNLQVHKILDFLEGLLGGHEVAVTEFAEHDGLQADAFGNFVESLAKFAVVKSLVKLFLIGGRGHIGKVDSHVGFRETREVRRGAGGHIQRPAWAASVVTRSLPSWQLGKSWMRIFLLLFFSTSSLNFS